MIVVTRRGRDDAGAVDDALFDAADQEGANPGWFSTQIFDPDFIADRRRIESFYMAEVDRDKIALAGEL